MTARPARNPPTGHSARDAFAAALLLSAAALAQGVQAQGRVVQVAMRDVAFAPAQVTVHLGNSVAWANDDIVAHTATSNDGGFDVSVAPGGNMTVVMTRPGTFGYICRYHPNMKGQVVVTP